MKVLIINSVCGIRSTGRICTDLATDLDLKGHEVKIAYGRENVPDQYKKYAIRIGSELDIKLHGIRARLTDADGRGSVWATRKFIKWVIEFDPDVIHLHNLHGYYINVPLLFEYIKKYNKKVIWTLHDMWSFTGHGCTCDLYDCEKWKQGCGNCPAYKSYPTSITDHSSVNYAWKKSLFSNIKDMTIVTPSKWLAGLARQSYLGDKKVVTINNGINIHLFEPLENDFRKFYGIENKIVLMVRQQDDDESKYLTRYLELARKIDSRFQLVLVGLKKSQIQELPQTILGIERTNSLKELKEIYKAADAFLDFTYGDSKQNLGTTTFTCEKIRIGFTQSGVLNYSDNDINWVKNGDIDAAVGYLEREYPHGGEGDSSKPIPEDKDGYFATRQKYNFIGKNVILGVSVFWGKRKGLETFVQLDKELSEDYRIVIVGLDNGMGFSDRVTVIPRTDSQEELRKLYASADVFLNPTVQDNYPTVNLEASACNTPVITYDVGGSPENSYTPSCVIKKGDYTVLKKVIEAKTYEDALCITNREALGKEYMSNEYQKLYGL